VIPTTSLAPESAQQPKKTSWLSLRGWAPSFVDEEEIVATMAAAMSSCWRRQECAVDNLKRAGGGRGRRRTQGQGGGVSSHNVHTVAPCYGELLALLVIPTWLLHWFPRFESLSNCVPLAWNLPLSARYLRYVAAPLLVPAWGALAVVA
jgi:hypothetical protein